MATAQETYAMLDKQSLWATATRVHEALAARSIPHALLGGVAVCLHGYQRNTVDIDLLVRGEDSEAIRACMQSSGLTGDAVPKEFKSETDPLVQCLVAGERAGPGSEVRLPDPGDSAAVTEVEGLPVLSLARLIEAKIACGEGNVRRTYKDLADVVELIAANQLGGEFARHLHKSLRRRYRRLVKHARGET